MLAFTFGVFFLSRVLQKKTGWVVLNPILLTIAVLILFLKFTGISYETYNEGGHLIEFWLKPAVVALGVPLYLQLEMIKKQLLLLSFHSWQVVWWDWWPWWSLPNCWEPLRDYLFIGS